MAERMPGPPEPQTLDAPRRHDDLPVNLYNLPAEEQIAAIRRRADSGHPGAFTNAIELVRRLEAERARLHALIHNAHTDEFLEAVRLEAAFQQEKWGAESDAGKSPADWFWLLGYLGGKALHALTSGNRKKALHHTISSAAALLNWHKHIKTGSSAMRPGIETPPGES